MGLEQGPLSLVSTTEELFRRKISGSGLKIKIMAIGDPPRSLRDTPVSPKVDTNFADEWLSLGLCSFLADSGHEV
jgi:hypothetical protein